MNKLHLPWLEITVALPLIGACLIHFIRTPDLARRLAIIFSGVALLGSSAAWLDLVYLHQFQAVDRWSLLRTLFGFDPLIIDELSAPLIPVSALLFLMLLLTTLPTKAPRFSFSWALAAESLLLATLSCRDRWTLVSLLALGVVPPWMELKRRRKPTRVYLLHMGLFITLMVLGFVILEAAEPGGMGEFVGIFLATSAILIRCGIVPLHCWITDLFEHATLGTALLFVSPMVGEYAALRLVLPIAPEWVLRSIAILSLVTSMYAAAMAIVQVEARRFFCYLFLSHSSLVLVGLESLSPLGLSGGLSVWLSGALALSGLGLTLRSLESRTGRLSLTEYHGMYEHTPTLAAFFLLTGLASVGFPGTFGFVGTELLIDGVVQVYPYVGIAVVVALTLNGIAIIKTYFILFTGRRDAVSVSLHSRGVERWGVLFLTLLILGGGLFPGPGINSRFHAAEALIKSRLSLTPPDSAASRADEHRRLVPEANRSSPSEKTQSVELGSTKRTFPDLH